MISKLKVLNDPFDERKPSRNAKSPSLRSSRLWLGAVNQCKGTVTAGVKSWVTR